MTDEIDEPMVLNPKLNSMLAERKRRRSIEMETQTLTKKSNNHERGNTDSDTQSEIN